MIVAAFIGFTFLLFVYYVWIEVGELLECELADTFGAGESLGDARGVRDSGGLSATLTSSAVGADSPFDGSAP